MTRDMAQDQLQSRVLNWLTRRTINSAVRRVSELPIAIGTDIGVVRTENQDRVAVLRAQVSQHQAFVATILCDGMGGMVEGATCASLAISGFLSSCVRNCDLELIERINRATHEANRLVGEAFGGRGGATLSAVIIDSVCGVAGVNVGDSRIYAHDKGFLRQLTIDDTIAGQFQKDGDQYPRRNDLIQFIGVGEGLEPHIISIEAGLEVLVLTSDGVHFLDKNAMQAVLQHAKEPAIAIRRLTEISKWCGGHDNASTAVVSPIAVSLPPSDEIGVIQIWDPFGELQIIGLEMLNDGRHEENQPPSKPEAVATAAKPTKKQRQPKRKVDRNQDEDVIEREVVVRPQLKIDFDDDADGGSHG